MAKLKKGDEVTYIDVFTKKEHKGTVDYVHHTGAIFVIPEGDATCVQGIQVVEHNDELLKVAPLS